MEEAADADRIFLRSAASSSTATTRAKAVGTGVGRTGAQDYRGTASLIRAEIESAIALTALMTTGAAAILCIAERI